LTHQLRLTAVEVIDALATPTPEKAANNNGMF
jgi:hypothetical protein